LKGQHQITAKEEHMCQRLRFQIRFDDHHDIEWLGKRFVPRLELIDARFDPLVDAGVAQIALWKRAWLDLVAVDAPRSVSSIWTIIGQVQGAIRTQLAN